MSADDRNGNFGACRSIKDRHYERIVWYAALATAAAWRTDVRRWHAVPVSGPAIVDGLESLGPYFLVSGEVGYPDIVPTDWISADGTTWTKISLPAGTTRLEWVSGHLIAFGQTQAYVSPPVPGEQLVPSP